MIKIIPDHEGWLTQWDKNRTVLVSGLDLTEYPDAVIQFSSPNDGVDKAYVIKPYVGDDGLVRAKFPNIFLTFPGRVDVCVYRDDHACSFGVLVVAPREKPDDYVYTETEVLKYEDFVKRLDGLETQKEDKANRVTTVDDNSDDGHYPTAKAVYKAIPKSLKNPYSLTFTGAVTGSYDGSKPMTFNIPVGGGDDVSVEPAEDDIPKVFFGGALQQTKDAAVVPFRYISKTQDISGYAEIKAQGNSSMSYPKKNQTVKLFKDADCTEKLKVDFKGWGMQNKHVYKANWIDLSHARNVVSARIWADVVKSRSNYAELPELLRTSPNHGAVDGFPVKVYADGVYQGRYTLNIPKDKWAFNMDDTLDKHCVLCGENYASGCFRAAANINGNDWSDEIHDVVPASIKTRWNEVISFVMNSTDDEFKMNLGQYFDIQSLIDYHLFGLQSCGLDAYGKNQIYMTYDGQKWIASMYDMDSTWGLYWNGSKFVATDYARTSYEDFVSTGSSGEGNLLYIRLEQLFWEELQTRWAELKNGALSIENIINRFERFTDIAPADLVAEDYANTTGGGAFTGIPSQSTNNIQQIRSFALARRVWTDAYVAALSGGEEPDEPGTTLISVSAEYSGGEVEVGTAVTDLTGIVVTAHYSDGTTATVTGYALSGEIAEGTNTITVTYNGMTTTFTVIGVVEESDLPIDYTINPLENVSWNIGRGVGENTLVEQDSTTDSLTGKFTLQNCLYLLNPNGLTWATLNVYDKAGTCLGKICNGAASTPMYVVALPGYKYNLQIASVDETSLQGVTLMPVDNRGTKTDSTTVDMGTVAWVGGTNYVETPVENIMPGITGSNWRTAINSSNYFLFYSNSSGAHQTKTKLSTMPAFSLKWLSNGIVCIYNFFGTDPNAAVEWFAEHDSLIINAKE